MIRRIFRSNFISKNLILFFISFGLLSILCVSSCGNGKEEVEKENFTEEESELAKENLMKGHLTERDRVVIIKDMLKKSKGEEKEDLIDKKDIGIE